MLVDHRPADAVTRLLLAAAATELFGQHVHHECVAFRMAPKHINLTPGFGGMCRLKKVSLVVFLVTQTSLLWLWQGRRCPIRRPRMSNPRLRVNVNSISLFAELTLRSSPGRD